MIEIVGLSKTFGRTTAVDDLSFVVRPGRVTGFLGPNGAGKTTTLRCLLGLVTPSSGTTHIAGKPYHQLSQPMTRVGAALEATNFHPGRSGRNHLRALCLASGLPQTQADAALQRVGLTPAADQRVWGYSLGMRQRLQLASLLLGDPDVLVLDEPTNGLDPEGIAWLRALLRHYADDGRTVLISSHLLSEVEQSVDDVVIITRGRLVRSGSLAELTADGRSTLVRTPDPSTLAAELHRRLEATTEANEEGLLVVRGATPQEVGRIALAAGVELHELREAVSDLEQIFLSLTDESTPPVPS